jgi:hypothetical protein
LLFPRVLPELVRLTVAVFVGIFGDIPASLMTQYQRAVPYCRFDAPAEFLDQCIGQLGLGLANAWGKGWTIGTATRYAVSRSPTSC